MAHEPPSASYRVQGGTARAEWNKRGMQIVDALAHHREEQARLQQEHEVRKRCANTLAQPAPRHACVADCSRRHVRVAA